jgi:hypothetical protein
MNISKVRPQRRIYLQEKERSVSDTVATFAIDASLIGIVICCFVVVVVENKADPIRLFSRSFTKHPNSPQLGEHQFHYHENFNGTPI